MSARTPRSRSRLATALARCPEADRMLLALLLIEGLSPSEVADILGVSTDTVRRAHARLIASMRVAVATSRPRRAARLGRAA